MKVFVIVTLLAAAVAAVSAGSVEAEFLFKLPDGYEWLEVQLILMSSGGVKPTLTEEQWFQLEALMEKAEFDRLNALLGDYEQNTPGILIEGNTVEKTENWETTTDWEMTTDDWDEKRLDGSGWFDDLEQEDGSGSGWLDGSGFKPMDKIWKEKEDLKESTSSEEEKENILEIFEKPTDRKLGPKYQLHHGKHGKHLALMISLPIIGFLVLLILVLGACCLYRRRTQATNYERFDQARDEKKIPI